MKALRSPKNWCWPEIPLSDTPVPAASEIKPAPQADCLSPIILAALIVWSLVVAQSRVTGVIFGSIIPYNHLPASVGIGAFVQALLLGVPALFWRYSGATRATKPCSGRWL